MKDVVTPATVAELTWLVGSWQATLPGLGNDCPVEPQDLVSVLEFLPPWGGTLPGIWRLSPDSLNLLTIREVDQTLEWTEQEFSTRLQPRPNTSPLVYRLHSSGKTSLGFETFGSMSDHGIKALRMEFSLTEPGKLRLKFFRLGRDNAWVLARDAVHDRGFVA